MDSNPEYSLLALTLVGLIVFCVGGGVFAACFGRGHYAWAAKNIETGDICQPIYNTQSDAQEARRLRSQYGLETVLVVVYRDWLGRTREVVEVE